MTGEQRKWAEIQAMKREMANIRNSAPRSGSVPMTEEQARAHYAKMRLDAEHREAKANLDALKQTRGYFDNWKAQPQD
jgi:hypothetical protein